ncbi:hypothetical protein [Streptomyces mirabilis]|uniref:hypothetical protein n=1 Tax=Streptomyces mirabilis TaxID=68239 RepID=UPI003664189F
MRCRRHTREPIRRAGRQASTVHRNSAELYTYLSEKIGALDGVQAVETALTLRLVKQLAYDPGR